MKNMIIVYRREEPRSPLTLLLNLAYLAHEQDFDIVIKFSLSDLESSFDDILRIIIAPLTEVEHRHLQLNHTSMRRCSRKKPREGELIRLCSVYHRHNEPRLISQ